MKSHASFLPGFFVGLALTGLYHTGLAQTETPVSAHKSHSTFGVRLSPIIFRVQENEDYFLPNDQFKLGIASAFQFEYFIGRKRDYGIRISLEGVQRNGTYKFGSTELVRREFLLSLPLEFVLRERIDENWHLAASFGGQYTELAQRHTYRIDPITGKTVRQEDNWIYGLPGFVGSGGVVKTGALLEHQFGIRYYRDLGTFSKMVGGSNGPSLHYEYYGLYYSLSLSRQ